MNGPVHFDAFPDHFASFEPYRFCTFTIGYFTLLISSVTNTDLTSKPMHPIVFAQSSTSTN